MPMKSPFEGGPKVNVGSEPGHKTEGGGTKRIVRPARPVVTPPGAADEYGASDMTRREYPQGPRKGRG